MSRLVFPNYFLIWIGSAVKNETEHREREGGEKDLGHEVTFDVSVGHDLFKSKYDELSVGRTLWVFKRVALISIAVYTGYVCEGFEVSLPERGRISHVIMNARLCSHTLTVVNFPFCCSFLPRAPSLQTLGLSNNSATARQTA